MSHRHSELLASIDRRLWRDLGFADPEPALLPFLPMLVVAWADGVLGKTEGPRIRDRARPLAPHLRAWIDERLAHPPGPYFRCQVSHLLAFMANTWSDEQAHDGCLDWTTTGDKWAKEILAEEGFFARLFGAGAQRARQDLNALNEAMNEHGIFVSDRIWALARGTHADGPPRRVALTQPDGEQVNQALGIAFSGEGQHLAVGTLQALQRDEDLDHRRVAALLASSRHLRENERWVMLGEEFFRAARPLSTLQRDALRVALNESCGCTFEECSFAEMQYLEDALAIDARWCSWVAGHIEELSIDRDEVLRNQVPGSFASPRAKVKASVSPQLIAGPPGLAFRVLNIDAGDRTLRLTSPVITQEPATKECVQWISRFLPAMCDPWTQLILDEDGPRWVAEVLPEMATQPPTVPEPLLPGRALLVPPWVWFRAASSLGVRFFSGPRKQPAGR